uniref:Uncharacterized protein n=1 Tax=Glossina pallidipes TaxID=7398 RepID=A0A1A9ZHC9_GLOPL
MKIITTIKRITSKLEIKLEKGAIVGGKQKKRILAVHLSTIKSKVSLERVSSLSEEENDLAFTGSLITRALYSEALSMPFRPKTPYKILETSNNKLI